jgi:molecular chaperone GrpE (heat shock protein)
MGKGAIMSPEVIQFARSAQGAHDDGHQLDKAGETILQLLNKAADAAEENSRHALGMAQKLSGQLRAAEDRVAELEAELATYQQRAERAEQWLHRVYTEIEDRFLQQSDSRHAMNGAPQRSQNARRAR